MVNFTKILVGAGLAGGSIFFTPFFPDEILLVPTGLVLILDGITDSTVRFTRK